MFWKEWWRMIKQKKLLAALLAACLCVQPVSSALGDTCIAGEQEEPIGPGYAPEPTTDKAWTRDGDHYVDSDGNVIEGALLRGISVSKWQGEVDWGRVAADDVAFALIRMASIGYEGEYTMDETFDRNMREAKANGVHTSPYIYLQTKTVEEARAAAAFAVEQARQYEITYPIAVDVESQYILELSVQELTDVVNAFCQVIAEAGYTPIIYSDYYKFTHEMDTSQFPYDIWLARYGGDHVYPGRTMWQATDKGTIDGIEGDVCLEYAFVDYAAGHAGNDDGNQNFTPGEWRQEDDIWYFYHDGQKMTGWIYPDGNWYYMDPANGGALTANVSMEIDGVLYFFNGSGVMEEQ